MPRPRDTIAAIATASGHGGVGIVRLSGPLSFSIAEKVFIPAHPPLSPWPTHQLLYGKMIEISGEKIDDGFAVRMEKPNSYTGEDVVELQGHGSPIALDQLLASCLSQGARLAEPGEFTRRAFENGRIDLIQAEAVAELINAKSDAELKAARQRLDGKFSNVLHDLHRLTVEVLAECEADVDFPEENLPLENRSTLLQKFSELRQRGEKIRDSYSSNQRLSTGFFVALIGKPNVGKSSLFNSLLQVDRAIVTPIAGTTRDVISEELILGGQRIRLIDTAGLRDQVHDIIEQIGIQRTHKERDRADLILFVVDGSKPLSREEIRALEDLPTQKTWIIQNKSDIGFGTVNKGWRSFKTSIITGEGVEVLKSAIDQQAKSSTESAVEGGISNDRQKELIDQFLEGIEKGEAELKKKSSPEFVSFELHQAHRAISRMLGKDEGIEEILGEIFSKFCIGK